VWTTIISHLSTTLLSNPVHQNYILLIRGAYFCSMHQIANEHLQVQIDAKGAELKSLYSKSLDLEYLWCADPAYWAKTSPILFPIVGTLKDNTYYHEGQAYSLSRHGFARERAFTVTAQSADSITFSLESDEESLKVYPFRFTFSITYTLTGPTLSVSYRVDNNGDAPLYFSVGGHPAFKLPLVEGTTYTDYRLVFEKNETAGRWPISKEGLIEMTPQPLLEQTNILPLRKELFSKDAVVLKHLQSTWVALQSDQTPHGFRFSFPGFPFLGLWAAPGADFICIEPWCGIADSVASNQQLADKEGIVKLAPAGVFERVWHVEVY
jgi:galactose mutarotase-like enzyme